MNKYDVSGLLRTYSQQVLNANDTEHLRDIVRQLKDELDLRRIRQEGENSNDT